MGAWVFEDTNMTDVYFGVSAPGENWHEEWADGHKARRILEHTVRELIERTSPDLITISGDLAWAGHDHAYDMLASFIDSFNIPWANVWGNHDNQNGAEYIDSVATRYMSYKNCIYEKGDRSLGNGNYVICIEEQGSHEELLEKDGIYAYLYKM